MIFKGLIIRICVPILIGIITSCATSFNTKKTKVHIRHEKGIEVVSVEKLIKKDERDYILLRSNEDLKIKLKVDSTIKYLSILARKSIVYWENILNFGIGFLWDKKSVKQYSYPRMIYLEKVDSTIKVLNYPTTKKGVIEICPSLPYVNSFYIRSTNGFYSSGGFMGLGIGFNYYYADNNYISITGGAAADIPIPVPAAIDYFGEMQRVNITYLSLRIHKKFGRFDLGYGLSGSNSTWTYRSAPSENAIRLHKENICLGLSLNAKIRFLRFLNAGIIYQPSFVTLNNGSVFGYQHFISAEVGMNLMLWRPRKKSK